LIASTTEALQILNQICETLKQKETNIGYLQFQLDLLSKEVALLRKLKEAAETSVKHNESYHKTDVLLSPNSQNATVIRHSYEFGGQGSPLLNVTVSCVTPQQLSPRRQKHSIPTSHNPNYSVDKENDSSNNGC
jgi:hypothetical protein